MSLMKAPGEIERRIANALGVLERFSDEVVEIVNSIRVDDLVDGGLNPYLLVSMGVRDFRDIAYLFVHKRVVKSLETSFGYVLEEFLREVLGGKSGKDHEECRSSRGKSWICWWDIVLEGEYEERGIKFRGRVISVKSGSANVSKETLEDFAQRAAEAERHGYRSYLALMYGKRVFNVIGVLKSSLKSAGARWEDPGDYVLVGRRVYEVLLGYDVYEYVMQKAIEIGVRMNFRDLIEKKINEILLELNKRFNNVNELLTEMA
ncbi:hypothetical protein B7L70_03400 [Vulcanisaeta sp. EB80]|jgi:hypothetical protein|uniref:hypothetical protein n=1 Tax=Vulcanisaeta sp. EB80 TaxID=1650660 RepID=UPI0009C0DD46|nr:hypothetical protein [Vulcanisaeta sp. EB80]PLC68424.1 hypothetical protein B7L70_03400 [Vulcanisaeta sp. EB80]